MRVRARELCAGLLAVFAGTVLAQNPAPGPRDSYQKGTRLFEQHHFSEAKEAFNGAIALDALYGDAYRGLGLADLELKDYEGAYHAWLKAVELNPKDQQAKYCLGRLFYDADLPEQAAVWLRQALELNPSDYKAATYLGLCAEALNLDDTAVRLYRSAIAASEAQQKPYSWAFLSLGKYYKKHGEKSQAIAILQQGVEKCPEAHELTALGEMLASSDAEDAEELLRRAIAMDPSLSHAHYRLALLLQSAGRSAEARTEMLKFQEAKKQEDKAPKVTALRKQAVTSQ